VRQMLTVRKNANACCSPLPTRIQCRKNLVALLKEA
jgi:hypothetical protein